MFTIINGAYIILKNESSRSLSELSVGPRSGDALRLEVRRDVSSLLGVVSLIKQSEGIPRMYRPFEYGVVLSYLNLKPHGYVSTSPGTNSIEPQPCTHFIPVGVSIERLTNHRFGRAPGFGVHQFPVEIRYSPDELAICSSTSRVDDFLFL